MGIQEQIKEIEAEMARTQKNKATEGHLGRLKAKLAKLRTELLAPAKTSGGKGEGFDVTKAGHARVALVGFPSVGKSSLLAELTGTESEAAAYEFTTLTCIPGVINYNDAKIQLLDLPGIVEGAAQGKGRGRQVIGTARSADLILMMLDAAKGDVHRQLLTHELDQCGIRLNQQPPNIEYSLRKLGGVKFKSTVPLTKTDERTVRGILHDR
ncbi:MAG: Developmentally-regulated GTP-binding protein 2, partial [Cercozoa sp. M6MM]